MDVVQEIDGRVNRTLRQAGKALYQPTIDHVQSVWRYTLTAQDLQTLNNGQQVELTYWKSVDPKVEVTVIINPPNKGDQNND